MVTSSNPCWAHPVVCDTDECSQHMTRAYGCSGNSIIARCLPSPCLVTKSGLVLSSKLLWHCAMGGEGVDCMYVWLCVHECSSPWCQAAL